MMINLAVLIGVLAVATIFCVVVFFQWLEGSKALDDVRSALQYSDEQRTKLKCALQEAEAKVYKRPARVVMKDELLYEALAVGEEHPVFRGLLVLIDRKLALAVEQVSDPEMVKTEAGALPVVHTAGGIEWLDDLRDDLRDTRMEAVRRQVEGDRATR